MRIAHARILLLEFNAENCLPFLLVFLPLVLFGFLSLCPTHRQSWWGLWMLRRLLACRAALPTRWQWMSRAKYLPGGPAVRASWGWAWQSRSSECLGTVGLTGWVYQGIVASVGHVTNFLQSNTTVGIMQWQKERQLSSALLKFKCHPCYPSFQCLWVCCMTMSLVGNISSQLVFLLALKHGRGSILCLLSLACNFICLFLYHLISMLLEQGTGLRLWLQRDTPFKKKKSSGFFVVEGPV